MVVLVLILLLDTMVSKARYAVHGCSLVLGSFRGSPHYAYTHGLWMACKRWHFVMY